MPLLSLLCPSVVISNYLSLIQRNKATKTYKIRQKRIIKVKIKEEMSKSTFTILKLGKNAQKWANETQTADSIQLLYYDLTAKGTITAPNGVQKNAEILFHISKDYKIIKDPSRITKRTI